LTAELLAQHSGLLGIYSCGAGNRGIAEALETSGRARDIVWIAHEVTQHTRRFLVRGTIDAIINALHVRADQPRSGTHPHRYLPARQPAVTASPAIVVTKALSRAEGALREHVTQIIQVRPNKVTPHATANRSWS
jgi:ABC-type sugar transport system substrate-binding protein